MQVKSLIFTYTKVVYLFTTLIYTLYNFQQLSY